VEEGCKAKEAIQQGNDSKISLSLSPGIQFKQFYFSLIIMEANLNHSDCTGVV
jgi:hypothetical protein